MDEDVLRAINQKIISQIESTHPMLLSELDLDENDLKCIRGDSSYLVSSALFGLHKYELLAVYFMMDVGMRNYHDGRYWDDFWNEVPIPHSVNDQTILGRYFIDVTKKYGMAHLEDSGRKYVNNIMMHAFIPENQDYRNAFFNFVLKFYRVVLNASIPEDLDRQLQIMADVFKNKKLDEYPEFGSLQLIVTTKYVLSDVDLFGNTVTKIIRRFADDYDSLDEVSLGRYENSFREWVNDRQHGKLRRRGIGDKPYLHFDIESNSIILVIPPMEIDNPSISEYIITSSSGEILKKDKLSSSQQFGRTITDEFGVPVLWNPLSDFAVVVGRKTVLETGMRSHVFLNKNGNQRGKVALGFNMVIVPRGASINLKTTCVHDVRDYTIEAFMINRGEILEIEDERFTVEEEISPDIHVVTACIDIGCADQDGNKYNIYSDHPEIRFSNLKNGKFRLSVIRRMHSLSFDSLEDLRKDTAATEQGSDILLDLSKTDLDRSDGLYRVRFNGKEIYRYILLCGFEYHFDKELYEEDQLSMVSYTGNSDGIEFDTRDGEVHLEPMVKDGRELNLILQVPSRRFSFDRKVWHMFGESLYFRDAQYSRLYIYCPTLVYPTIVVHYKGSKPIDLEIEGRLLSCNINKISMIEKILEHSKKNIASLKFFCGRFHLFTILYNAEYHVKYGMPARIKCQKAIANTRSVCKDLSTGIEYEITDEFTVPDGVNEFEIGEYYDGDFGSEYRVVERVMLYFQLDSEHIGMIQSGSEFPSVVCRNGIRFPGSDFRNLIELDRPFDLETESIIHDRYQNNNETISKMYVIVCDVIKKAMLDDKNQNRLRKRIFRFRSADPKFAYSLCCKYLEHVSDPDIDNIREQLEKYQI